MTQPRAPLTGMFAPTYIDNSASSKDQAEEILDHVARYCKQGFKKVGIIYSASHEQVEKKIKPAYAAEQWKTGIIGNNTQSTVLQQLERLLSNEKYAYLQKQKVFRILPITTWATSDGKGDVDQSWLEEDLKGITDFLSPPENGVVLGWQNSLANDELPKKYAIGIEANQLSKRMIPEKNITQDQYVQETLSKLAVDYPLVDHPIQKKATRTPPPPEPEKRGTLGKILGGILGAGISVIPIILIATGVILLPLTFGGTSILIGAGLGVIVGTALGAWAGYTIGHYFDTHQPPPPAPVVSPDTSTQGQLLGSTLAPQAPSTPPASPSITGTQQPAANPPPSAPPQPSSENAPNDNVSSSSKPNAP